MKASLSIVSVLAASVSILVFPWPVSVVLILLASASVPPAGLVLGVFADSLYGVPGASLLPVGTLFGLAASVAGFFVHRFVKTRIMGA